MLCLGKWKFEFLFVLFLVGSISLLSLKVFKLATDQILGSYSSGWTQLTCVLVFKRDLSSDQIQGCQTVHAQRCEHLKVWVKVKSVLRFLLPLHPCKGPLKAWEFSSAIYAQVLTALTPSPLKKLARLTCLSETSLCSHRAHQFSGRPLPIQTEQL
jgi:hypothetical protein